MIGALAITAAILAGFIALRWVIARAKPLHRPAEQPAHSPVDLDQHELVVDRGGVTNWRDAA